MTDSTGPVTGAAKGKLVPGQEPTHDARPPAGHARNPRVISVRSTGPTRMAGRSGEEIPMNIIALILLIVAAVLFLVGGSYKTAPGWYSNTNLGLALLTVGLIVQFAATSHSVTF
jgi:hypothetical protein